MRPRISAKSTYSKLADAGSALLILGCGGAMAGAASSLAIVVLLIGPDALYASLRGALSGFCAAVCGAGLGGPLGWKLSGAFRGSYGGYNLVLRMSRDPVAAGSGSGLAALLVLGTAGLAGWVLGAVAASRDMLQPTNASQASSFGPLMREAPLAIRAIPIRLALVATQLLPVLTTIPGALAHVPMGLQWIHEIK